MVTKYSFSKFQALDVKSFAKIVFVTQDGANVEELYFDIISIHTHFALNSIPTATLTCNVGRNVYNGMPSILHSLIKSDAPEASAYIPVTVYARVMTTSATGFADTTWLPGNPAFTIFMGYVTGIGIDTTTSSNRLVLHCTSFLSDLSFSSAVSRTSVPSNPANISFNPVHSTPIAGIGGEPGAYYIQGLPHLADFNEQQMRENLWFGIAKFFEKLCSEDRFGLSPTFMGSVNGINNINYEALRALQFFEGFPSGPEYKFGVPAKLRLAASTSPGMETVINNIIKAFTSTGKPDAIATSTLWDKLVGEYSAMFMLAVIPMVDRCLVVPHMPNLRGYYKEIMAYETMAASSQTNLIRPLRGVAIMVSGSDLAGGMGNITGEPPNTEFVGGYYESKDFPTGQILVKRAPPWLEGVVLTPPTSFRTASPTQPKGSIASPGTGNPVDMQVKSYQQFPLLTSIADTIANVYYGFERLKERQLMLTTNFRVDIAPGSILKVNVAEDPYVLNVLGQPRKILHGCVNRVTFAFDCEQQQAYTSLNLTHVRTSAENDFSDMCNDEHPLYENAYYGAPLVSWLPPAL